jgi:hypothetical protein
MSHAPQSQPQPKAPPPQQGNGFGWGGLALAVCGLTLFWIPMVFPAAGIAAIALSAIGYARAKAGNATNGGWAMLGMVLGTLSVVLPVVAILAPAYYVALNV